MAVKVAKQTYWYTADKKEVVRDGDPRAAFLLVRQGSPVDGEVADFYGLDTEEIQANRVPMPGANNPSAIVSQAQAAATREIARQTANRVAGAGDATTGFQVSAMIAHRATEDAARAAEAEGREEDAEAIREAPVDARARASMEHAKGSQTGGDLFTGARAAEAAGEQLGGAYKDRTEDNREAGASSVPEMAQSRPAAVETRAASVQPPPEAGGGAGLKAGTQEYREGDGKAITPAGTEREDKTQPPPASVQTKTDAPPLAASTAAPAPLQPAQTPARVESGAQTSAQTASGGAPGTAQHNAPQVDKGLPEALTEAGVETGEETADKDKKPA